MARTTKNKPVSVRKNGKTYYGIVAQRMLAAKAARAQKRAQRTNTASVGKTKRSKLDQMTKQFEALSEKYHAEKDPIKKHKLARKLFLLQGEALQESKKATNPAKGTRTRLSFGSREAAQISRKLKSAAGDLLSLSEAKSGKAKVEAAFRKVNDLITLEAKKRRTALAATRKATNPARKGTRQYDNRTESGIKARTISAAVKKLARYEDQLAQKQATLAKAQSAGKPVGDLKEQIRSLKYDIAEAKREVAVWREYPAKRRNTTGSARKPMQQKIVMVKGTGSKDAQAVLIARGYKVVSSWVDDNLFSKGNRYFKIAHPVWSGKDVRLSPVPSPARQRRNAADYSPATPIAVTRHFRSGGPGYMTQRERIIKAGQRDMFAPEASMNDLLGFLRKNPTVLSAVQKKMGKGFLTASNSELKKQMRQVALAALKAKAPAKRKSNPQQRRNSADAVHEMFLGRPVEFEYEVEAPKNTPNDLAKLGVLTRLIIIDKDDPHTLIELSFDDVAQMAPDLCADGRGNLHVVGGTYRIEPKGIWGEIEKIGYLAAKDHLDGKEYEWIHTFGEEGGTRPRFKADDEGFIHIVGGDYTLEAAGIRD